jgi:hypothetical protein
MLKEKQSCVFLDKSQLDHSNNNSNNNSDNNLNKNLNNNSADFIQQQIKTSFRENFWQLWKDKQYKLPSIEDQNKVFMFEFCTEKQKLIIARGSVRIKHK